MIPVYCTYNLYNLTRYGVFIQPSYRKHDLPFPILLLAFFPKKQSKIVWKKKKGAFLNTHTSLPSVMCWKLDKQSTVLFLPKYPNLLDGKICKNIFKR